MKVHWLRTALQNLDNIAADNPDAARALVFHIKTVVKQLSADPALGRASVVPGVRELVTTGTPCVIPYRVRRERLEILRVFHGAQNWSEWEQHLKNSK